MMLFHFEPLDTVIQELESHPSAGLSSAQIPEKLSQFGENKLTEKKKKTNFQRFLDQFKDESLERLL